MTADNNNQPLPPTVNDLSDRLYEVIADGIDNLFRVYFKGADVITDDRFFRINSGLPHPMANLMITWKQNEIEILTEGIEPYTSDAFPSGVLCLGDVGGQGCIDLDEIFLFRPLKVEGAPGIPLEPSQGLYMPFVENGDHAPCLPSR